MIKRLQTSDSRRGEHHSPCGFRADLRGGHARIFHRPWLHLLRPNPGEILCGCSGPGWPGEATARAQVQANAIACAKLNTINGQSVTLQNSDVVLGTWSTSALTFTPGASGANAVQVTVTFDHGGGEQPG